ncbi:DUF1657 domain-containing protein [Paenibacillus prosopidis]|uniref:Uncharacterized protein DUF1657 n=1 Tax=Paenibacillus prosopidis TaxID=630520 RepID=A0A368VLM3_9BACL|nr:DUF1657 domain-containing protein [Paenibacillus prosopidis]RCW42410.1 uncharacterized protein DUF1657 [Paenibacillus prosopidis]
MTVGSDLKPAVASLKSAQVSFEQFALNTQNQQAVIHSEDQNVMNGDEEAISSIQDEQDGKIGTHDKVREIQWNEH